MISFTTKNIHILLLMSLCTSAIYATAKEDAPQKDAALKEEDIELVSLFDVTPKAHQEFRVAALNDNPGYLEGNAIREAAMTPNTLEKEFERLRGVGEVAAVRKGDRTTILGEILVTNQLNGKPDDKQTWIFNLATRNKDAKVVETALVKGALAYAQRKEIPSLKRAEPASAIGQIRTLEALGFKVCGHDISPTTAPDGSKGRELGAIVFEKQLDYVLVEQPTAGQATASGDSKNCSIQ